MGDFEKDRLEFKVTKDMDLVVTLYEKAMRCGHQCKQRCSLVLSTN